MNERKLRIDSFNSFIQFISTQMRHISVLTAIIFHFICICAYAQSENHITESENDVKTTTLQELVVTSDYAWVDGEKFVFVPRKNEKNLATDAISLIENMHIPVLYVDKGNIKAELEAACQFSSTAFQPMIWICQRSGPRTPSGWNLWKVLPTPNLKENTIS